MDFIKRMTEIRSRKAELRTTLETDTKADIDAIEKELRELNEEYAALEKRKAIIDGLNSGEVSANEINNPFEARNGQPTNGAAEYRSAWLKNIRNIELDDAEKRALTTATNSAGAVVPKVTQNKIIEKVKQLCPLLTKIDLLHVPGGVTIPAEGTTADAATHAEGATITADADTFTSVILSAYEVTKLVTISKSVERMSVDAFENWLVNKIARKITDKINALIFKGTGTGEAQGINAITWNATNSITVAKTASLTATDVKNLVGMLNGGYDKGAEWLMSKSTFFADFHPLMNNSKDNIVTRENGTYYVMGYPVSFDDEFTLHEAILGNIYRGYVGNMPEEITVTSQFVARENSYDFLGSAMFDGKVQAVEAFVKLIKATA